MTAETAPHTRQVAVPIAGLWTDPTLLRPIDKPLLGPSADPAAWAGGLGAAERRQLWGLLDSQLLLGEPVQVLRERDGWAQVVAIAQPSSRDTRGYPGWIPADQLAAPAPATGRNVVVQTLATDLRTEPAGPVAIADVGFGTILPAGDRYPPDPARPDRDTGDAGWIAVHLPGERTAYAAAAHVTDLRERPQQVTAEQLLHHARGFLGRMYVAGGMHRAGLDCSALVHLTYRRYGHTVARDARDQAHLGEPVDLNDLTAGDLLFFTNPDTGRIYHVGYSTGGDRMLHVSQPDWSCLEQPMPAWRRADLTSARRLHH